MAPEDNGWDEWKRHVLKELERQGAKLGEISETITKLEVGVATMRVKASWLGLVAGGLGAALFAVAHALLNGK